MKKYLPILLAVLTAGALWAASTMEIPSNVSVTGDITIAGANHLQIDGLTANDCISNGLENVLFYDVNCNDVLDAEDEDLSVDDAGGLGAVVRDFVYPSYALAALEHAADSTPPLNKTAGTNVDVLTLDFDASTDECSAGIIVVPTDIDSAGTVQFLASWFSATVTVNEVIWDIRHSGGQSEGASWDTALSTEASAADTTQGTVKQITNTIWTETVATLGWAANDVVNFELCRDANNAGDDMASDAALLSFRIEVPLA